MPRHILYTAVLFVLCTFIYTPAAMAQSQKGEVRPYSDNSPWNMPIGPNPSYDSHSSGYTDAMNGVFGSDTSRYTMPVYIVNSKTPLSRISYSGRFSEVVRKGRRVKVHRAGIISVPIPAHARPAAGRDGQIIVWNPDTGEEWGFWRIEKAGDSWMCTNGYKYNTNWSGIPPFGFLSRGAGVTYLVGLIRPWEIEQGHIDHAIAFGMNYPSRLNIPPATRSDGRGMFPNPPMGSRLQLDPSLSEADFDAWGLDRTGKIIARALQKYGMILIDSSGHPKIYAEYDGTAKWGKILNPKTIRSIPYSAFKMLDMRTPSQLPPPTAVQELNGTITWQSVRFANRYRVEKRCSGSQYEIVDPWIEGTSWSGDIQPGCDYVVRAVNHNGPGRASVRVKSKP